MARRVYRHPLWELYLMLSASNSAFSLGLTEAKARQRIREFVPSFGGDLDIVIQHSGDVSRIPADVLDRTDAILTAESAALHPTENMNQRIREGAGRGKPQEPAKPVNQETRMDTLLDKLAAQLAPAAPAEPETPKPQPKDMNAILRQLANR